MCYLFAVMAAVCLAGHHFAPGIFRDVSGLLEQALLAAACWYSGARGAAFAFAVGAVSFALRIFRRYDFRAQAVLQLVLLVGVVALGWDNLLCSLLALPAMFWLQIMRMYGGSDGADDGARRRNEEYFENSVSRRFLPFSRAAAACEINLAMWIACFILMGNGISAAAYSALFMCNLAAILEHAFEGSVCEHRRYRKQARKYKRYIRQ